MRYIFLVIVFTFNLISLQAQTTEQDTVVLLPYPNPVTDWLTIPATATTIIVEFFDSKGLFIDAKLSSGYEEHVLNVSFLYSGFYLLRVYDEPNYVLYRIIKLTN